VAFVHPTWGIGPITGSANLTLDGNLVADFQDLQLLLGLAYCTIKFAQVGTTTVIAVYANDLTFAGSSDTCLKVVNKNMTSLKISPWPSPAPGAKVTYIATVSETPGTGTLTGTVSFTENGVAVSSCTNVALKGSSASCTITLTSPGSFTTGAA
jgi:hypothetical protein